VVGFRFGCFWQRAEHWGGFQELGDPGEVMGVAHVADRFERNSVRDPDFTRQ
jgi:hypothetical protein